MGRDITQCHPRLQAKAKELISICASQGIHIKIGECFRTVAEQDALYAQGRTKPGPIVTNARGSSYSSQHQWGIAFDFYLNMDVDGDGKTTDDAFNDTTRLFEKVGNIAVSIGLGWGGNWVSIIDKPHIYLPEWGSGTGMLKQQFKTPDNFKKTWRGVEVQITDNKPISTGTSMVEVTASSLIIRDAPLGNDTGKRYKRGQRITPLEKLFANGKPWFRTNDGWVSAEYLEGWIKEDGKWWYLMAGYTYPAGKLQVIDGAAYCFDYNGWLITCDRVKADGQII